MRTHLNADNAAELFELCRRRSFRQVDELLAARFPKPDVRDLVRRLPARPPATFNVESGAPDGPRSPDFQRETPTTEPEQPPQPLRPPQPLQPPAQRRIEPLSADRYGVHFTADTEFRELLERVRALASHRLPGGDLKTVLQRGLEAYERELLESRFKVGKRPRASKRADAGPSASALPSTPPSALPRAKAYRSTQRHRSANRSRYVAAATAREVYARDHGQCTFVSSDGHRCSARYFLQLDHIDPHARGGPSTPENLRLRCRAHNLWHARRCFGEARMRQRARSKSQP